MVFYWESLAKEWNSPDIRQAYRRHMPGVRKKETSSESAFSIPEILPRPGQNVARELVNGSCVPRLRRHH